MQTKTHKVRNSILILLCFALAAGGWLWYDTNVDRSGWKETQNGMGYTDFHGKLITGWLEVDGSHYYFGDDHILTTHWLELDGQRYYMGPEGIRSTGWQEIDGQRYYFDENGVMLTGWQEIDGIYRLLKDSGALATGWLETAAGMQYFRDDGTFTTGFLQLESGSIYYFNEYGYMHTGLLELDGDTYCFRADGTMVTGWTTEGEYDYYFLENGTMATSTQEIDGITYYFAPGGQRVILVNPWNYLPEDLVLNLVELDNGQKVDRSCYTALMQMLFDCEAAGYSPYVCSGYRTQEKQEYLLENKIKNLMKENKKLTREEAEAEAKTTVAIPGTSEHQLGLAVDIISDESYTLDYTQANTQTQQWLMEHCWDYGFILRYPEDATDITGIIYEPWHYRYVGQEIALEIQELGITLEEYLGAVVTESAEEIQAVG